MVYTKSWVVEIILDLAGYTPDRRLADFVALEPSAGDGAFLLAMVRRLVESCLQHGIPLSEATEAIRAFEIDPLSAQQAIEVVQEVLTEFHISADLAAELAQGWIKIGDFLEESLGFPIADRLPRSRPDDERLPAGRGRGLAPGDSRGEGAILPQFLRHHAGEG